MEKKTAIWAKTLPFAQRLEAQRVADLQRGRIGLQQDLDRVAKRAPVVVRLRRADLQDGAHVLGIAFTHGGPRSLGALPRLEDVFDSVVPQVFLEGVGRQLDHLRRRGDAYDVGPRSLQRDAEVGRDFVVPPQPHPRMSDLPAAHDGHISHSAAGDRVFALVERAVVERDRGVRVRRQIEALGLQEHFVGAGGQGRRQDKRRPKPH